MPDEPIPGRALATRRAVADIVRAATLGSYGVAGFAGGPFERLNAFLEGRPPGVRIRLAGPRLTIRLHLRVAHSVPIAEVARQVDSAIRYGIRRAMGREVDELAIRVGGLVTEIASQPPPTPPRRRRRRNADLADSGMDVA